MYSNNWHGSPIPQRNKQIISPNSKTQEQKEMSKSWIVDLMSEIPINGQKSPCKPIDEAEK